MKHDEAAYGKLKRLDISVSRNWILATDTTEFMCDLATFDIFYRPIVTDDLIARREAELNDHGEFEVQDTSGRGRPWGQVCNWKLWNQPDDTNRAVQIVLTSPEGEHHYLIAPETFRAKLEQRKRWLHEDYKDLDQVSTER